MLKKCKFIKSLHKYPGEMPKLTKKRCMDNFYNGVETTIQLDLNIIDEMSKVVNKEVDFKDSVLSSIVKIIEDLPYVYLAPGIAFSEVNERFKNSRYRGFELFLKEYLPRYGDAHNAVHDVEKKINMKMFDELSNEEKEIYGISYVSLLIINYINRKFKSLSPLGKFHKFLNYVTDEVNIASALEIEIAKYYFADDFSVKDNNHENKIKSIKKNFIKPSQKADNLFRNCLNGARDIFYYRNATLLDLHDLDGIKQDTWLLTDDKGIRSFSEAICFVPDPFRSFEAFACILKDDNISLVAQEYFDECTKIQNRKVYNRLVARIDGKIKEFCFERLKKCVAELERYFCNEQNIIYASHK